MYIGSAVKDNAGGASRYGENLPVLLKLCTVLVQQAADAPQCRDIIQQISSLRAQYDAKLAAGQDFLLVAKLGTQLQGLEKKSAQLPLSDEDYLTLAARHAALVQRVTEQCRELTRAKDYAALGPLSAKLQELKALDLSWIAGTSKEDDGENDPAVVAIRSDEDDGANDPLMELSARN
jgi:hypothetical protein